MNEWRPDLLRRYSDRFGRDLGVPGAALLADPGAPTLYLDGFATSGGKARLAARPYLPPGAAADASFPLLLVTGRRAEHYNSGTMTRRTPNLRLRDRERLDISPQDAAALGIGDDDPVEVTSPSGTTTLPARVTDELPVGQLFAGFHFPGAAVNEATSSLGDVVTGCPECKVTAVRLRRV